VKISIEHFSRSESPKDAEFLGVETREQFEAEHERPTKEGWTLMVREVVLGRGFHHTVNQKFSRLMPIQVLQFRTCCQFCEVWEKSMISEQNVTCRYKTELQGDIEDLR